jgi:hypothetical protein
VTTDVDRSAEWAWIVANGSPWLLGETGCLTFARGVSERGVLEAFAMDPDTAVPLTAAEAEAQILATLGNDGPYWVRVAHVDGWGIAVEQYEFKARLDNIGARLATDGESVVVDTNFKGFGSVDYFVAGAWISHFGINEGYDTRAGREPDHFHDALAAVGLGGLDDGTMADRPRMPDQIVGILTMLTNELGIHLSHDVYAGPLLTASRTERHVHHLRG